LHRVELESQNVLNTPEIGGIQRPNSLKLVGGRRIILGVAKTATIHTQVNEV
jgi:hypothetical protein